MLISHGEDFLIKLLRLQADQTVSMEQSCPSSSDMLILQLQLPQSHIPVDLSSATVLVNRLLCGWPRRASELSGLWPRITWGVRCHGDDPHLVFLVCACRIADLSRTVCPFHWWAPVGCISSLSCRNCVSRRHLILTWMIRPPGKPSGRSVVDRFCGEPALAGLASAVTSTRTGLRTCGRKRLPDGRR